MTVAVTVAGRGPFRLVHVSLRALVSSVETARPQEARSGEKRPAGPRSDEP